MATNIYDATTVAINNQLRVAHNQFAESKNSPLLTKQSSKFPLLSEAKENLVLANKL